MFRLETSLYSFRTLFVLFLPRVADAFNLSIVDRESCEFFASVVRSSLEHRKITGIRRGDLIDLCIDALKAWIIECN